MKSYPFIILITLLLGLYACKPEYATENSIKTPKVKQVKIEQLEISKEPIPIESSGKLASKAEIALSFKVGGIIQNIAVEEGQAVRKGQLLASLNLAEINARVMQAKNAVEKSQRDLERVKRLFADTVATLEQVQDLTTAYEVAKADLEIAEFNKQYAQIVAPANGKVMRRFADAGELINPGNPVFLIGSNNSNNNSYIMKIGVADRDIIRVNMQDSAWISFDAYPNRSFKALVTEIAEAADPLTGTYELELTLQPSPYRLKNGFIGKVSVFPSEQEAYYKIPMHAMIEGERKEVKVFVPDAQTQTAKKIAVYPAYIGKDYFTVSATTFSQEPKVITEGAAYLKEGEAFEILD